MANMIRRLLCRVGRHSWCYTYNAFTHATTRECMAVGCGAKQKKVGTNTWVGITTIL